MNFGFYDIFKVFFKVGCLLLGGGYVILPLLQSELCDKRNWIIEDELYEYYALSQSIPGIIAANIAIFVGYKLNKIAGAASAIFGLILPAFLAIIILAQILSLIMNLQFVQSIFWGIGIGVLMLLFLAVREMWQKSIKNRISCYIFLITFLLSAFFNVPPALIIILAVIYAIITAFHEKEVIL